jgi:hypothetical protein
VCDESGAKGYDDRAIELPGDIGVMAGYVFPDSKKDELTDALDTVFLPFQIAGKLHITDFSSEEQAEIRSRLFQYFRSAASRTPCLLYEGIHEAGFHAHGEIVRNKILQADSNRRSPIAVSGNLPKDLLHAQLFSAVFEKTVNFCAEYFGGGPTHIVCVTDNVDGRTLKEFLSAAEELTRLGDLEIDQTTGFNRVTKEVVSGTMMSAIHGLPDTFDGVSYQIEMEDSCLTFAADVLANSLRHHLLQRPGDFRTGNLNDTLAVLGHPLSQCFAGLWTDPDTRSPSDAIYMHPAERRRLGI